MLYYWINEGFTDHGEAITLNEDKSIATTIMTDNDEWKDIYNTVYGNTVINLYDTSIAKYKWTLNIKERDSEYLGMIIGIDSSNNKWINDAFVYGDVSSSDINQNHMQLVHMD